jgi:hypothetical protein
MGMGFFVNLLIIALLLLIFISHLIVSRGINIVRGKVTHFIQKMEPFPDINYKTM